MSATDFYDPRNHDRMCGYRVDQYGWECDCGALARFAQIRRLTRDVRPDPAILSQLSSEQGRVVEP